MAMIEAKDGLLPGRKHAPRMLGDVLVLGLGKSGRAVLEYCLPLVGERIGSLSVAADAAPDDEQFVRELAEQGVTCLFDGCVADRAFDVCIASPGIPATSKLYADAVAASGELISEIEFAWRESTQDSRWVAVTGTNGKTTTTTLAAHILSAAGLVTRAVGNIGDVSIAHIAQDAADVYVAEVSSFQLASTSLFAPNVAVILNITPDHLSWHGGFEQYAQAKLRVLANLDAVDGAVAVLDATDDVVRATVRKLKADGAARGFSYVPVGTAAGVRESMIDRCGSDNAAFVDTTAALRIVLDGREAQLCSTEELAIAGDHNIGNALAAASAAFALGVDAPTIAQALRTFKPLEHRVEPCGEIDGMAFVNDSKGTNVDASVKAVRAFAAGTVVLLAGGCDKGTDLAPLIAAAREHAKAVVCFGDAGARFAAAFSEDACEHPEGAPAVLRANHLADALDLACEQASAGDTVLLSPACSSFDEFTSFEQRGTVFKKLVAERGARTR